MTKLVDLLEQVKAADEPRYLDPLEAIVEANETPAEALLKLYNGPWKKSVDPVFDLLAY